MELTTSALKEAVAVEEVMPGYYSARIGIDLKRKIHSLPDSGTIILGHGMDRIEGIAIEKAISELIERYAFFMTSYDLDGSDRQSSSLRHEIKNSTGIACHVNRELAIQHAFSEIIERDQITLFWRLVEWPVATVTADMIDPCLLKSLNDMGFDVFVWECSQVENVPVVVAALVDTEGKVSFGSAAGDLRQSIEKSIGEAFVLSGTIKNLRDVRFDELSGSPYRIMKASNNWKEIERYINGKPIKSLSDYRGECIPLCGYLGSVGVVEIQIPNIFKFKGRVLVRLIAETAFNINHGYERFSKIALASINDRGDSQKIGILSLGGINNSTIPFG